MADWLLPDVNTGNDVVWDRVKDRDDSLARMFDGTLSWTSLPAGTIRLNRTGKKFEEWSGSAWGLPFTEPWLISVDKVDGEHAADFASAVGGAGARVAKDSDLLDGQDSTFYRNANNLNAGTVKLARGGVNASLVDPNADRIFFWDESAGAGAFLAPGANLAITGTTLDVSPQGTGSGLNADTVDGSHATTFAFRANNLSDLGNAATARTNLGGVPTSGGGNFPNVNDNVTATDEELNNADQSATSGGGFMKGPTTSTDPGLAFNTWRTPNANRATFVLLGLKAETDGVTNGVVTISVDESGGTSIDYNLAGAFADSALAAHDDFVTVSLVVPAGGSFKINNPLDPNNANNIDDHREFTL